jgi:hypothetical protein
MIDIGKLTTEQTADLLRQVINVLPEETLFQVLNEALSTEQKEELGEQWFNIDRE